MFKVFTLINRRLATNYLVNSRYLRGVSNNEDIKSHIFPGSRWRLRASGRFKKACPRGGGDPPSKAAASFARGVCWHDVSAHGPKRAKLVSPKVRKTGENAAGGFFQQTLARKSQNSQIFIRPNTSPNFAGLRNSPFTRGQAI